MTLVNIVFLQLSLSENIEQKAYCMLPNLKLLKFGHFFARLEYEIVEMVMVGKERSFFNGKKA
jgi:hypothetical protein